MENRDREAVGFEFIVKKKGFKKRQKNREKQTHHSTQCARMDLNEEFLSQRLLHHEKDCKKVQNHQ